MDNVRGLLIIIDGNAIIVRTPEGFGGGGDVEKIEVVPKSRELARRVVEKYKL